MELPMPVNAAAGGRMVLSENAEKVFDGTIPKSVGEWRINTKGNDLIVQMEGRQITEIKDSSYQCTDDPTGFNMPGRHYRLQIFTN